MEKPRTVFPTLLREALLGFFSSEIIIIGVDEVGRGCLAGPVVAAAAVLDPAFVKSLGYTPTGRRPLRVSEDAHPLFSVRDSKLIPEPDRAPLALHVQTSVRAFAIGEASVGEIERLNILYASHLAMERAVAEVEAKLGRQADAILVDGHIVPKMLRNRGQAIVGGDQKSLSIACASVIAKVHRDTMMESLDLQYPGYGFKAHKGYPTPFHKMQIRTLGVTDIHRKGFKGVADVNDDPSLDEPTLF